MRFLKDSSFSTVGMPKAIIGGGSHFCSKHFDRVLKKYKITNKVATLYHPKTSNKIESETRKSKGFWNALCAL